jgi:hypothetical protein
MGQSSTQSEAVVRRFFELLNAEDLEGVRTLLTEDGAWLPQARDMPGAGEYRGRNVVVDEFLTPIRGLFAPGAAPAPLDGLPGPCAMETWHRAPEDVARDNRYACLRGSGKVADP